MVIAMVEPSMNDPEPRKLQQLLKEDTYQGMTDTEINLVLEFWVNHNLRVSEYRERMDMYNDYIHYLIDSREGVARMAQADFDATLTESADYISELHYNVPTPAETVPDPEMLKTIEEMENV